MPSAASRWAIARPMFREPVEQQRPGNVEQQPRPVSGSATVVELMTQVKRDLDEGALGHPFAGRRGNRCRTRPVLAARLARRLWRGIDALESPGAAARGFQYKSRAGKPLPHCVNHQRIPSALPFAAPHQVPGWHELR